MSKRKKAAHPESLPASALYRVCDPSLLDFTTTAELQDDGDGPGPALGQERAVEAIRFAIGMRHRGFNLFALGEEGTGRRNLILDHLGEAAAARPASDDWVYVENFAEAAKPRALRLPAGRARVLERDMAHLVEELGHALPAAFEAEDYRVRRQMIEAEAKQQRETAFTAIQEDAEAHGIALVRTPTGLGLAPSKGDEVLPPDEFKQLPEETQARLRAEMERLQQRLESTIKLVPRWDRDMRGRLRELEREVVGHAIAHLMDDLKGDWAELPEVLAYLDEVARDVALSAQDFLPESEEPERRAEGRPHGHDGRFRRYRVNVLVCREGDKGAPVVMETYPTQPNLIGRVEYIAQYGTLITDFNLIKAGSLHRANGGYLVMDALKLLMHPFAWEDLKRALRDREIRIESPGQAMGLMSTLSLEPQPIPLDLKVVLVGDPMLYYLLSHNDPEFGELFKVSADFDWRMERSETNTSLLARSVGALARKEGLRPLDRGAVARIVEQASRDVGDSTRLSTHMASLADLVREADYWAGEAGADLVVADHVERAISASTRRLDRVRDSVQQEMLAGTVHIATEGEAVGQINGLAVLELGRFSFGRPTRVTARVRFGKGDVVDIEREVQLGGPIHGKGVMILSSFLASRYAAELPLALSATLVFEQSYGGIEGDSASSTELYALLSALAEAPIRQSLAVTGSIDQFGRIQAIGGVNEKIEGFFDLCRARGLDGSHGVLIPADNVPHLMLRKDVVEAAAAGLFAVYPVENVDQGMALLTGHPAGERDGDGKFPPGSINRRVAARLGAFMRRAEELSVPRPLNGMGRNGA
ncbi:Lon protease family protein [Paramagnetospirillum magneticum]|uniref:endopeptidase La n=1 Tax=Paramagnetospirillum magneticum (strain ATCC 700264 / AMB-1) TaxID=342108 RepID=Q2W9V7_PARM1|nr:ATP-binding protein [Paramagnetospirillum magneticum]BAE49368.1 Predicted ATP-dependent protease [Paramagnetospirillum magneticum AMB-1]